MLNTIIVFPDGTEISSGVNTKNAIQSCTYTECVNSGTELTLGSVCSACVEIKLISTDGSLQISAGEELQIYKNDGNARRLLGIFIAEKPTKPSAYTMKLTAYDRISKLDKDLTEFVSSLTGWPYSLYDMAKMVCDACGVSLINTEIQNGSYLVQKFSADRITGRKIMQWIGEASGRFCRATADGKLEFSWYAPISGHSVGATEKIKYGNLDSSYDKATGALSISESRIIVSHNDGSVYIVSDEIVFTSEKNGDLAIHTGEIEQHFYFQGGLSYEDYVVSAIEKVQIQLSDEDIGVIWPNNSELANTYRITGNLLLNDERAEVLRPVAETLYEQLKTIKYTPCKVSIPANMEISAGNILEITDRNGKIITAYVMEKTQAGQKDTLQCTGSHRRDSVSAFNEQSYSDLAGKVLNLRVDIDGIKAENKSSNGRMAALELTLEGVATQVEQQTQDAQILHTALTTVQQTANAIRLSVQAIEEDGVSKVQTGMGYTFDDAGLQIARQGAQMQNRLDNTGMYVERSGQTVLRANSDGVAAADITVKNYLVVGTSRLETYEMNRTACFYIGG